MGPENLGLNVGDKGCEHFKWCWHIRKIYIEIQIDPSRDVPQQNTDAEGDCNDSDVL